MEKQIIRSIIAMVLSFIVVASTYAVTPAEARFIYNKIAKENGFILYPTLVFVPMKIDNAFSGKSIAITYQFMNKLNADEIALVLSHELAHYKNQDRTRSKSCTLGLKGTCVKLEQKADQDGAKYANQAGFSVCNGKSHLRFLVDTHLTNVELNHPRSATRYKFYSTYCK